MFDFSSGNIYLRDLTPEQLKYVQDLLNKAGYSLVVDGIYGVKTEIAFTNFKSDNYLEFPLTLGQSTLNVLEEEAKIRSTPSKPSKETSAIVPGNGTLIKKVAGFDGVYTTTRASKYFTWGEITHNGTRHIYNPQHANNAQLLALRLDGFREYVNKPFIVTSWYRPEPWNSRAGGAKNSQHLYGRGVDLKVLGMTGRELAELAVKYGWRGGIGVYTKVPGIVHLDTGSPRKWGF